jgi:predicted alpha/beta superfamily hydrolase
MKKLAFLFIPLFSFLACERYQLYREGETDCFDLSSSFVQDDFEIWVYLPVDFSPDQSYPLAVVLDGNYDFKPTAKDLAVAWDEGRMEPLILVGIGYPRQKDRKRFRDYTFPENDDFDETTGGAPDFVAFLEDELLPYLQNKYPIDTDEQVLMGHSLGGLFVNYALLQYPETSFSGFIGASPALWWVDETPLDWEETYWSQSDSLPVKVYLTAGDEENEDIIQSTQRMADRLASRNYAGLEILHTTIQGADHDGTTPVSYIDGLEWMMQE